MIQTNLATEKKGRKNDDQTWTGPPEPTATKPYGKHHQEQDQFRWSQWKRRYVRRNPQRSMCRIFERPIHFTNVRPNKQTRDTHRRTNKLATARTVTVKCLSLWIDQQKQVQLVGFCKPASGLTRNLVFEPKHRPQVVTLCWEKPKTHTETYARRGMNKTSVASEEV